MFRLEGGGKLWASLKCGLTDTSMQVTGSLKIWPNCSEWSSYKDYIVNFPYNIWFLANKVEREKRATSDLQRTIFNPATLTTAGKLDSSGRQKQQLVRLYQKSDFESGGKDHVATDRSSGKFKSVEQNENSHFKSSPHSIRVCYQVVSPTQQAKSNPVGRNQGGEEDGEGAGLQHMKVISPGRRGTGCSTLQRWPPGKFWDFLSVYKKPQHHRINSFLTSARIISIPVSSQIWTSPLVPN